MQVPHLLEVGICDRTVFYYVHSVGFFQCLSIVHAISGEKNHEVYFHIYMLANLLFKSLYILSSLINVHY